MRCTIKSQLKMGNTEVLRSENLTPHDPLQELKKDAQKILHLAAKKNVEVTITVLGALHEGIPGTDIVNTVSSSDGVSLELPSIAVKAHLRGEMTRVDENGFWGNVLNNTKRAVGVNNNRAAVNAIRILDDRVRVGQQVPDSSPDLAVSSRNIRFGRGKVLEKAEIADLEFIRQIQEQEKRSTNLYPSLAYVLKEGVEHFVHVNRPTMGKNSLSAVLVSGNFMLPMEYSLKHGFKIFGDDVAGIAGIDICGFALSHLLRMRVDKTQVEGMLKELTSVLKSSPDKKRLFITHVGGAAHNTNLVGILNELFKSGNAVTIADMRDSECRE